MPEGTHVTMRVVVAEGDRAAFDDEVIHEVYGTTAMVRHAEQVSRWLFRRCLETDEEGAGVEISLTHRRPVRVGATVDLTATVVESTERRMVTEIVVREVDGAGGKSSDGAAEPAARARFVQLLIDPATFGR